MNRRHFLKYGLHGACGAMTSTTLLSGAATLLATGRAAATDTSGYKALVCILLAGGNDSYNMLVRRDQPGYNEYAGIRSDLALPRQSLLALNGSGRGDNAGMEFGLHPGMPELQGLYNSGKAAFVANVGTLVERVSGGNALLPLELYSHNDQIDQWQTSLPQTRAKTGWGGRMADLIAQSQGTPFVSSHISLAGTNLFQVGEQSGGLAIDPSGNLEVMRSYADDELYAGTLRAGVDRLLGGNHAGLLQRAYAEDFRKALDAKQAYKQALQNLPPLNASFSSNEVSQAMQSIARTIAAREVLGHSRQTFFLVFGGWDHHDELLNAQAGMLPLVSKAVHELYQATENMGVANQVTSFTISEFGRTLTSNGRGSDHGWGGVQFAVGGAVKGGEVYGAFPSLAAGNPLDNGRGRLTPTLSTDEYAAELALWFGVAPSELATVLPNISNFYAPAFGTAPIGFMA